MPSNQSKEEKGFNDLKTYHLKKPEIYNTLRNKIFFIGQNSLTGAKGLADQAAQDSDEKVTLN
jgi:hypothetical protein